MQYKDRMDFVFVSEIQIARALTAGELEHKDYVQLAKKLDNIKTVPSDLTRQYVLEYGKMLQEALKIR